MRHNFRELMIWKDAMKLVKTIYTITSQLPQSETYGLASQLQRSAVSIPSNIAEGSGRGSDKELNYFLTIGLSSSYELETQLILINELYNIDIAAELEQLHRLQKMIGGFKRSLKASEN